MSSTADLTDYLRTHDLLTRRDGELVAFGMCAGLTVLVRGQGRKPYRARIVGRYQGGIVVMPEPFCDPAWQTLVPESWLTPLPEVQ